MLLLSKTSIPIQSLRELFCNSAIVDVLALRNTGFGRNHNKHLFTHFH